MAKRRSSEEKLLEDMFILFFRLIYWGFMAIFWFYKGIFMCIWWIIKAIIRLIENSSEKSKYQHSTRYVLNISEDDKILLNQIDNMDGHEFERFITEVLKKNGYTNVYTTKASGDYGADVIGELEGVKYAFQCKRFESKIGPKPIGEVLRGMNHYHCQKGVVITNNFFTPQAQKESQVNNVELWDRNKVLQLCRSERMKNKTEEPIKFIDNSIDWKPIAIGAGVVMFVIICMALAWNLGTSDDTRKNDSVKTYSLNKNAIVEDNKNKENSNENIVTEDKTQIPYLDLYKELSNYINSCLNSEQLEVEIKEDSMSIYHVQIEYILKDKNHTKEECDELFKAEITKVYDMLKDKEIVKSNSFGSDDYRNLAILISLAYKKQSTHGVEYTEAIGVESLKYSTDKWKKSYEDIMQKNVINREYDKMVEK